MSDKFAADDRDTQAQPAPRRPWVAPQLTALDIPSFTKGSGQFGNEGASTPSVAVS